MMLRTGVIFDSAGQKNRGPVQLAVQGKRTVGGIQLHVGAQRHVLEYTLECGVTHAGCAHQVRLIGGAGKRESPGVCLRIGL